METKLAYSYEFNDNRVLYFESEEIRDIYVKLNEEWGIHVYEDPCDGALIKSNINDRYIGDLLESMGFKHEEVEVRGKKFHNFIKGDCKFSHRDLFEFNEKKGENEEYKPVYSFD